MQQVQMNMADTGEVTRFYEDMPFEVDGIMYRPPQMSTRYTREFFRHQPMFILKSDESNDDHYYQQVREGTELTRV